MTRSPSSPVPTPDDVIADTRSWIERAVIGLNLCPFAKAVYVKEQIRYVVSDATHAEVLLGDLNRELRTLSVTAPDEVDTTLLIHPGTLTAFLDYNDFLAVGDAAIVALGLKGTVQLASFHPGYQFAGTEPDDVTNNTNRSPYPMLHLLREASVDRAVAAFPDAGTIYERNMETMRRCGTICVVLCLDCMVFRDERRVCIAIALLIMPATRIQRSEYRVVSAATRSAWLLLDELGRCRLGESVAHERDAAGHGLAIEGQVVDEQARLVGIAG
jgi:hypothetical protein